jgi:endonuclease/exonuclease/phosphatase family metal-dependent hydrolase
VALTLAGCSAGDDEDTSRSDSEISVAQTRQIKVLHWNISGAVLNRGFNNVVDKVLQDFDANKADVISINEGCRDQVEYLRDKLKDRGFSTTLQFAPTGNNALCAHSFGTNVLQAGPAILAVAGGRDGQNHYWNGTEAGDARTDRGMACLTADLGKPVRFCSMHLATADDTAAAQAESMIARWRTPFTDNPHVLIGDFNASPDYFKAHAPSLYAPTGLFFEADSKVNRATHGEGKLDYVFMSKGHFLDEASFESKDIGTHKPWWADRQPFSDHRLVRSEITMKL